MARVRKIVLVAHVFAMALRGAVERDARFNRPDPIAGSMLINERDECHFFGIEARGLRAGTFAAIARAICARFAAFAREIAANGSAATAAGTATRAAAGTATRAAAGAATGATARR